MGHSITSISHRLLACVFALNLFATFVVAETQISPHPSKGCRIYSTGEREAKYLCNEFETSLETVSGILVLSMQKEGSSVTRRYFLEERELQPSFFVQFRSALWVVENCNAKEACITRTFELGDRASLSECEGNFQMYSMHRGSFHDGIPILRTLEMGKALLCRSDQKLKALISAELLANGQGFFIVLPAENEK